MGSNRRLGPRTWGKGRERWAGAMLSFGSVGADEDPAECRVRTTRQSISVGGSSRTYLLAEPASPPSAVVLGLHGTRSTADRQARLSRMESWAAEQGAVVAFAEAVLPVGTGYQWDPANDMPFLVQLAETLIDRHHPPENRICMTGMSGGARMSCWFAADRADLVSCVGAVASLRAVADRSPTRPVPIVAFHDTPDPAGPWGVVKQEAHNLGGSLLSESRTRGARHPTRPGHRRHRPACQIPPGLYSHPARQRVVHTTPMAEQS